ncbi:gamma-glutamyltransferase family protein [Veronia pacifica]|uniref:Gamma-glutamyltransferase n=1 Tax=Veronia pacifica TaxID=1080227 RepID=A0A1C3ECF9_9GAMM|nr:gamma-glutamyltransferase family protein [Veronia pacifica]ODA30923.1 gamma-glutamyltransferase [Veronia pacifica]
MINPSQPYPSQRAPVCADNVLATSQPLAAQAGMDMLRRGGNAVDAALAAAITLTIVEPCSNGIGSDSFAIIWDGESLTGLNGSGRSPQAWTPEKFAGQNEMPLHGWDSVTVPGSVSSWVAMSERYGSMPFETLFEAAIHYAENGFQVGPVTSEHWRRSAETFKDFPDFVEHFLPVPKTGTRFFRPDAAKTLKDIAATRGESFYRGELAKKIEQASISGGGSLRASDLAAHQSEWVELVEQSYRDVVIHEIPPNGQGLAAQITLGILEQFPKADVDSTESVHQQIEAMKTGLTTVYEHLTDIDAMRVAPEDLLNAELLANAASNITHTASPLPPVSLPVSKDTVYLSVADKDGMMVSFIQSNYLGFGSGIVIPGTGITMQNRGFGFSTDPAHPNCVGPGKRPFHTIIPGFVTHKGQPALSFGVMGGPMQAQGHVQMVQRIFDHGQNPQAASDAPRWYLDEDFTVRLEPGFSEQVAHELEQKGHKVVFDDQIALYGGAQLILKTPDGYVAGSDHRKEGLATGF